MALTLEELRVTIDQRRSAVENLQKCAICHTPLQETITGNRLTDKGHVCSDCYFDLFGEELDKHPIYTHRKSRGA